MPANSRLRDLLERYRAGEVTLDAAAQEIEGLRIEAVGELAQIDLGRQVRCGLPEAVLAEGKTAAQLAAIVVSHARAAGRCLATRVAPEQADAAENRAAAPQQAHSAGNPISQREKAGFNWDAPDFSISAFDVGCGTPCASNSKLICLPEASRLSAISVLLILILQSPAAGLRQPVINLATCLGRFGDPFSPSIALTKASGLACKPPREPWCGSATA